MHASSSSVLLWIRLSTSVPLPILLHRLTTDDIRTTTHKAAGAPDAAHDVRHPTTSNQRRSTSLVLYNQGPHHLPHNQGSHLCQHYQCHLQATLQTMRRTHYTTHQCPDLLGISDFHALSTPTQFATYDAQHRTTTTPTITTTTSTTPTITTQVQAQHKTTPPPLHQRHNHN